MTALAFQQSLDSRADLARRFDALHELIYRRGGIRPVNAAIDELCKLLFLRVHVMRNPDTEVDGLPVASLFDASEIRRLGGNALGLLRRAFDRANSDPRYRWRGDGSSPTSARTGASPLPLCRSSGKNGPPTIRPRKDECVPLQSSIRTNWSRRMRDRLAPTDRKNTRSLTAESRHWPAPPAASEPLHPDRPGQAHPSARRNQAR